MAAPSRTSAPTRTVSLRLDAAERAALKSKAAAAGVSVSTYLRRAAGIEGDSTAEREQISADVPPSR